MRLDVLSCPHWHAGTCDHPEASKAYGARPSAGVCLGHCAVGRACGVARTGEMIDVPGPKSAAFDGSALWAELHRHALAPLPDWMDERRWLQRFVDRVPCGRCRQEAQMWLFLETPYRHADYFAATVDFHNDVNRKIGKPEMSLDDARKRWLP